MHPSDGEILAYQDGEISAKEFARLDDHLQTCSRCQQRAAALQEEAQRVSKQFASLEPDIHPISTPTARARLSMRLEESNKEVNSMWHKLTTHVPRQAWIALAAVAILAISLAFAPVRAIASSFLGLFRVEQVQVIEIDPDEISDQLDASSQYANLIGENVKVEDMGDPQEVESAAEASALADFAVRLPTSLEGDPLLTVQPGGSATFNVDLELVNAVLHDMGRSDIQLPRELDGASVKISIPSMVMAEYGDCRIEMPAHPERPATPLPRKADNCTVLTQLPSPTISAPPDLNIDEIGKAYLQLLGMEADEAEQFARSVDWTTTFIIPIPRYGTEYMEVMVGDVPGTLVYREGYEPFYVLLWVEDGILHALKGPGVGTEAVEIASSLE